MDDNSYMFRAEQTNIPPHKLISQTMINTGKDIEAKGKDYKDMAMFFMVSHDSMNEACTIGDSEYILNLIIDLLKRHIINSTHDLKSAAITMAYVTNGLMYETQQLAEKGNMTMQEIADFINQNPLTFK